MNLIALITEFKSILFIFIRLNNLIRLYDATMATLGSVLFLIQLLGYGHNHRFF